MARDAKTGAARSFSPNCTDSPDPTTKLISRTDARDDGSPWPVLGNKDDIPLWLRDNDFIITGHPMPTHSYRRSFRLWGCLHMETMNIWTHLLGTAGFIATGAYLCAHFKPSTGNLFAFGSSTAAATICFGLSTAFHTLRSHSYNVHHFWGKMDILGICFLALGCGTSITYYAFYCHPTIQRIYWGLNVASAALAAVTLFDTGGGGTKMRTLRGSVFTLLAVSAMLPLFHRVGTLGWDQACGELGLQWYLSEGLSLLVGVTCFVGRIPERFWPGAFDIWGHSHQLFHSFAVLAMGLHVVGLGVAFRYRQGNPQC